VTWPAVYVEAAFGADLGDGLNSYMWTDITYACPSFTVSSPSRDRFTDSFTPGTASFTLDNSSRLFDPFRTSGTYTSGGESLVRPNLPIRVSAVYSGVPYYLFTGYVDTIDVQWQDPADSVVTITCRASTQVESTPSLERAADTIRLLHHSMLQRGEVA
jgi:hypothetical protein